MATVGASPFIESFTLSGELLSSVPAVLSLLAVTVYLRRGGLGWIALAGLLTGCAVMIRQSAFDAGLAAVVYLALVERRRSLPRIGVQVAAAAVPVAAGVLAAHSASQWWSAVVAYRGHDSILTGSLVHRIGLLASSLPAAGKALALLLVLAAYGWRRSPLLVRLWLGAAVLGVLGGGNFHYHYYIQLVAPLAVLAGAGAARLIEERRRIPAAVAAVLAVATFAVTVPLWFESGEAQARAIWPRDHHLVHDGAVARYLRAHTRRGDEVMVVWAAASVYYLADRPPALRYLWLRNIQTIPGALAEARHALAQRRPALVAVVDPPSVADPQGVTGRILGAEYRQVAVVEGVPILRPRAGPS
jgi:hypothetical protein